MTMLREMGVTRHVRDWVVETRTRLIPELNMFKPSFHIYTDVWFDNNYDAMPVFVREVMRRAKIDCSWVDFGVYQPRSLLRIAGVSSKPDHPLPLVEEQHFSMCILASMGKQPDVTAKEMARLDLTWTPRSDIGDTEEDSDKDSDDDDDAIDHQSLKQTIMRLLKEHGERITSLDETNGLNSYYGNSSVGRNCLAFPGTTHKAGGNRCVISLDQKDGKTLWYRCLDPEHRHKPYKLGEI